jgi:hypothetical protein
MKVSLNFSNFVARKFIYLSILTLFSSSLTSCKGFVPQEDDATPYIVNFTLSKPTSATAVKNQYMPIEIRFDRNPSGYIHNVKVEILDEKLVLVEKLFESHVNTFKSYTYSEANAFKPLSIGAYKIKATTTDENGKQENTKSFDFTVQ